MIDIFESMMATFERSELIPTRFVEEGDTLAAELLWRGVIAGSKTPVEQHLACAYRFHDGLIAYTAWYPQLGDALDAVGLGRLAP